MKHILFIAIFFTAFCVQSQSKFGVTGGVTSANARATSLGQEASNSETGFYVGVVLDNPVSESLHIHTELVYVNVEDINFLQLPLLVKLYIANSGFNVQGGFQLTYTLEEVGPDFTKLNVGLGPGIGYDITDDVFVEARYMFQLNDYFTGPESVLESRIHFLNVGVGYKFL